MEVLDTAAFDWIRAETFQNGGRIWESEQYIIVHIPGKDRLVISFDNLASRRELEKRSPWAYGLIRKNGWGCLGVMSKKNGFFQSHGLHDDLDRIKHEGIIDAYPNVSLYGASSGGFAAAAFAGLAPGATVVAMSPQSSLSAKHAPFENRYSYMQWSEGWNDTPDDRYRDAVVGIATAAKAYLIYDPVDAIDAQHIARLRGPNTVELRAPYFTHKLPPMLKRIGALQDLAFGALTGQITQADFYKMIRARKTAVPHTLQVVTKAMERGHLDLAEQGARYAIAQGSNWKMRRLLQDIQDQKTQRVA